MKDELDADLIGDGISAKKNPLADDEVSADPDVVGDEDEAELDDEDEEEEM